MMQPPTKVLLIVFKNGREAVFPNAGFDEKQPNTVTVYDESSRAILAEFYRHELKSWNIVETSLHDGLRS